MLLTHKVAQEQIRAEHRHIPIRNIPLLSNGDRLTLPECRRHSIIHHSTTHTLVRVITPHLITHHVVMTDPHLEGLTPIGILERTELRP